MNNLAGSVGRSALRVDAYDKVTGRAKYTEDICDKNALVAKVVRSTIANGLVTGIDISEALKVEGVVKIITCFDVPDFKFPTAGHPWSVEEAHQDVADRKLLNRRVRYYGDDIAAVIAEDEVAAERAARLVRVDYDEYEPLLDVHEAMKEGVRAIHQECPGNVLKHTSYSIGDYDEAVKEKGLRHFDKVYSTSMVKHCHMELPIAFAYMEKDRVVVVSATQIPHIVRRVVGQALGIPWGKVRIIKPYIGGGFGNRQDVLYEPLVAYLTTQVGGRRVKLECTREEAFVNTRVRHAIEFRVQTHVRPDGRIVARRVEAFSNQGGYASHGHAIVSNSLSAFKVLYQDEKAVRGDAYTVYTNLPAAGAMRAYGIPQVNFAMEASMDDIAKEMGLDPMEFRRLNMIKEGWKDDFMGITVDSYGLDKCIQRGRDMMSWDEKYREYARPQTGNLRKGVGMAIFHYKTGVYPISLETASCRIIVNQDGSVQLQMGGTEIGQGADTVFTQMAADAIGIPMEDVHIVTVQDTDVTPYDSGAYASRQTYVSGMAARKAGLEVKRKLLEYAKVVTGVDSTVLDISGRNVVYSANGAKLFSLCDLCTEAFYSLKQTADLSAEVNYQCKTNAYSFGASFAEVEVDMALGKVRVVKLCSVHDSGRLINPQLAEAQVHGGMSMSLGYCLGERMLFDRKGKPLNNNFLDYKLQTALDTPELEVDFVETYEKTGPYGNKSLGEPPAIAPAAAVRNAILMATGEAFDELPITPQTMVERFFTNEGR